MLSQATGIEVVVDTAFYGPNTPTPDDTFDPEGILDGYVSYLVYVTMTHPTDALSAVFSDAEFYPDGGALGIDAECGCFNPISESMVLGANNSSLLWELDPMLSTTRISPLGRTAQTCQGSMLLGSPSRRFRKSLQQRNRRWSLLCRGYAGKCNRGRRFEGVGRQSTIRGLVVEHDVQVFPEGNQSAVDLHFWMPMVKEPLRS